MTAGSNKLIYITCSVVYESFLVRGEFCFQNIVVFTCGHIPPSRCPLFPSGL